MRPIELEMKNFTSLRDPGVIDFRDLDLFVISGPNGAGKSSVLEAMTFALYGKTPRAGSSVKDLIRLNEDSLQVKFVFAANGHEYRVYRHTGKGNRPPQIEQRAKGEDEWRPVEVRLASEVNEYIENLLGMDYDAFVRSVLLPQGEFQEFLAGNATQRRKVIDDLLQLHVYREMQTRVNGIATNAEAEAQRISDRLAREFEHATDDVRKSAEQELKDLEKRATEAETERQALEAASRCADALSAAVGRAASARQQKAATDSELKVKTSLLADGKKILDDLDARIVAVESEAKKVDYDPQLHLNLNKAVPILAEIANLATRKDRMARETSDGEALLSKLKKDAQTAEAAHETARAATVARRDEYDEARRNNAAAVLVQGLSAGDPCPICGQKLSKVDAVVHREFDRIKGAYEKAQAAEASAQNALNSAKQELVLKEQANVEAARQLTALGEDIKRQEGEAAKLLPDMDFDARAVEKRVSELESARTALASLEEQVLGLRSEREQAASAIAGAQGDVVRLEAEASRFDGDMARAEAEASAAGTALARSATEHEWQDVGLALESGRDPLPLVAARLREAQGEEAGVNQAIGSTRTRIEQIKRDIEQAKELRKAEKAHRAGASIANNLKSLLRDGALPTWIRERALRALAEDGSRRLNDISQKRYELEAAGNDFLVIDHWNGGESRSVKTLSGGETFLASLAMALALAEQLPGLAAGGGGGALECLFIDEGFSNLDQESLELVASALEEISIGEGRMVGVITHLTTLAERIEDRILVEKAQDGSTIRRVPERTGA